MFAFAAIAAAAPKAAPEKSLPLERPAAAVARVAACGFKNARAKFDDSMQEDVVEVPDVSTASEEQLRCAALASLASSYYVVFAGAVEQAYEPLYWRLSDEHAKVAARDWLDKRGLLARLPVFTAGTDEVRFAHTLETLCGRKAAGTLQPMHGRATFRAGALGTLTKRGFSRGKLDEETLFCLLNASAVSGYHLVFIGNGPAEEPH